MRCNFCGKTFDEESSRKACQRCAVFGGCKMLKCPHCGYEVPAEPGLIKWLKRKLKENND
ncbi:MAG: hypothetical protein GWP14_07370 [Actinobacteria bacterium]|nr:hypothetical protein [Actinomycetota bacterium]